MIEVNKRKIILGILLVLIVILGYIFINYKSQKIYKFTLPVENKVVSVGLEKASQNKLVGNEKEIKKIFKLLNGNYKTRQKNNNNVTNKLKITFYYENDIATIIYLYQKDNEYFLEQLNNGVYKIDKETYESIDKLF